MACPDRNKDQRILAEIERRKAMIEKSVVEEIIYEYMHFTDMDLQSIIWQIDQDRVQKIEKLDGVWIVTLTV